MVPKIKDYKCQDCGKAFNSATDLKTHVKCVHEKRKDFECEICGNKFARMSHKKRHVEGVHGKNKTTVDNFITVNDNS